MRIRSEALNFCHQNRSHIEPSKDKSGGISYELPRLYRPIVPQFCLGASLVYPSDEHPLKHLDNGYGCKRWTVPFLTLVRGTGSYDVQLQVMESYSYNGTFGLKVILRDRSVELLTPSWRYKALTFCHLTFSFDLILNHFHRLLDRCHYLDHRLLVFSFGSFGLHNLFVLVVKY